MAQRMTHTEAILALIQEHMGLPPIPLTPLVVALVSQAVSPADLAPAALAVHSPVAPTTASVALPADHPAVPTQLQDEDEIPPPTAT